MAIMQALPWEESLYLGLQNPCQRSKMKKCQDWCAKSRKKNILVGHVHSCAEVEPFVRSLMYSREEVMPAIPETLKILFKTEAKSEPRWGVARKSIVYGLRKVDGQYPGEPKCVPTKQHIVSSKSCFPTLGLLAFRKLWMYRPS